jgi:HAD superfamily hydrolase (TIGR01509 family)
MHSRWAVIFDLDGLLADTEPVWSESARVLLARRGLSFDPDLKPLFMGRHPLEVAGLLVERYDLDEDPESLLAERLAILEELYASGPIAPMPGAMRLVATLSKAAVPMAVASGSPTSVLRTVLERLDLSESFPVQLGSDQVARGKPAPDLFLLAAGQLAVPPRWCVVLEDAIAGVDGARAARMAVVAVPGEAVPRERVAHADLVAPSLEVLTPEILARLAQRNAT